MTDGVEVARPPNPDPDGEDEDGVEPVELLVQLAKQGDIDPWDVDIVTVTDEFLAALDEGDLRTSGRALFYASVLLRMKSDAMLADDDETDEPEEEQAAVPPWEEGPGNEFLGDVEGDPIDALENEMDRRLERKRARGTPMTLDELVRDLREAERGTWWKESRSYDTSESPSGFDRGVQTLDYRSGDEMRVEGEPAAADVTGTTHQEDVDDLIAAVWSRLESAYDNGRAEVLFEEVADATESRIESFLALLFLSHRGDVFLQQDELFGDLWIIDPDAEVGAIDDEEVDAIEDDGDVDAIEDDGDVDAIEADGDVDAGKDGA